MTDQPVNNLTSLTVLFWYFSTGPTGWDGPFSFSQGNPDGSSFNNFTPIFNQLIFNRNKTINDEIIITIEESFLMRLFTKKSSFPETIGNYCYYLALLKCICCRKLRESGISRNA